MAAEEDVKDMPTESVPVIAQTFDKDLRPDRVYGPGVKDEHGLNILPPDLAQKALEELNEDPATRMTFIAELRTTLEANPETKTLNIPLDNFSLIKFLRARKYNVQKAAELCVNYHSFQHKQGWEDIDPQVLGRVLESEVQLALPTRDRLGRQIILMKAGNMIKARFSMREMQHAAYHLLTLMMESTTLEADATHIHGYCMAEDLDMGPHGSMSSFPFDKEVMKTGREMLENAFPGRMKALYCVNPPGYMKFLWMLVRPFISKKLASRVSIMGSGLHLLQSVIDPASLPPSWGGTLQYTVTDYANLYLARYNLQLCVPEEIVLKQSYPERAVPESLGLTVSTMQTQYPQAGVMRVMRINEGSVAEQMGFKLNDVVMFVNGASVHKAKELKPKKQFEVTVYRFSDGQDLVARPLDGSAAATAGAVVSAEDVTIE